MGSNRSLVKIHILAFSGVICFNIFLTLVLPLQYFPGKHAHLLHVNLCSTGLSARTKPFSNFHIHEDRAYFPALSTHEICDKEGKGQIAALFPEVGQLFFHVAQCLEWGGDDQKVKF